MVRRGWVCWLLVVVCAAAAAPVAHASVGGKLIGIDLGGGIVDPGGNDDGGGLWDIGLWVEKVGRSGGFAPFIELRGLPWHGQQYSARVGTIMGWYGEACELWLPVSSSTSDNVTTTTYQMMGRYECVRGLELAVTTFFSDRDISPVIEAGLGRAGPGHIYMGASYNPVHDTWGGRLSWMAWGSRSTGIAGGFVIEGMFDDDMRVPLWGGVVVGWGGGAP